MGFIESVLKDSKTMETIVVMVFGVALWILAMKELMKKEEVVEDDDRAFRVKKKEQKTGSSLQLSYITQEQIMELTADQIKEISDAEVEQLPPEMKEIFRKRKNEVLLADKAKKSK